jgi:hypothetical protein
MRQAALVAVLLLLPATSRAQEPSALPASEEGGATYTVGRWATTVYGALKTDAIYDTTESFNDLAGAGQVQRPTGHPPPPPAAPITYQGDHSRAQLSIRDSRFGFKIRAPEVSRVRPTALLELDLFGSVPSGSSEAATFASPIPRVRHAYVRVDTPAVDILVGQTWDLFGWQNTYHPASVQSQGLPGQVYSRTPQIRVSKNVEIGPISVDFAAAAIRPPQRDSGFPEGQGGLKINVPAWSGITTAGAIGTAIQPLSVAVSGDLKQVVVPEFSALPKDTVSKTMSSIALNAFVPVLPATKEKRDNSLSVIGELVFGHGSADLYTNFTGGMTMPTVANTTGLNPPPTYPQNIDNGLVVFDLDGNLHSVNWTTFLVGAQYYLPRLDGRMWIAANYSHQESGNAHFYTRPYASTLPDPQSSYYVSEVLVRDSMDFVDALVMGEPILGLRIGAEYAVYLDRYVDKVRATNQRVVLGTIWIF